MRGSGVYVSRGSGWCGAHPTKCHGLWGWCEIKWATDAGAHGTMTVLVRQGRDERSMCNKLPASPVSLQEGHRDRDEQTRKAPESLAQIAAGGCTRRCPQPEVAHVRVPELPTAGGGTHPAGGARSITDAQGGRRKRDKACLGGGSSSGHSCIDPHRGPWPSSLKVEGVGLAAVSSWRPWKRCRHGRRFRPTWRAMG